MWTTSSSNFCCAEPSSPIASQPLGRGPAGRRLPLADLVAIDEQHAGAGAGELARDREPGEARAADEYVVLAVERSSLRAALRLAPWHRRPRVPFARATTSRWLFAIIDRRVRDRHNDYACPAGARRACLPQPNGGSTDLLIEVDGKLVPNYDATIKPFDEGDVVSGEVVRIDKDEVLVDIGYKSEGVIPANELSIRRSVDPSEEVSLGEQVDALVLTKEDQEGRLVLSKKRARFEKAWRKIEAAAESGEPVEGVVIEVVKGGLILDLGVRGFLPASLVDIRRVHNLDEFKGQTLECKVIELNRSRNNVVLSRRAVLEEERKEVREQILGRLQPGQVVEGKISNIVDFGAFVDLEGIDGLIHISELSWSHVNHPSEVLSIGETVRVKVLDIDRDRQRISLGLKQTQEDPWQTVLNEYKPSDILEGKVTKVVAFGAFVEIVPGVEGLVHISELAEHHVETPGEVVQPGQEVWVRILEIDEERRRISLSVKRAQAQRQPAAPRPDPAGAPARQPAAPAAAGCPPRRPTSTSPRRSSLRAGRRGRPESPRRAGSPTRSAERRAGRRARSRRAGGSPPRRRPRLPPRRPRLPRSAPATRRASPTSAP